MAEPSDAVRGPAPRWAHLTYTSFEPENGPGGWQVKETSGALTASEADELKMRVVTTFDAATPLPQFPTAEELERLPRRFTYVRGQDGTAAVWHAVQAGSDRMGRPGNVFSHVVLDRSPDAPEPPLRVIDAWRSPDLLVPFGPDDVLGATLSARGFPAGGPEAGIDAVLEFVLEPTTWRVGLLCVLMDAVSAALDGGPRVVLVAGSADSAARWIAAVTYLMSPGTSRSLSWSVYERASSLPTLWARGVHLAGVPAADHAQVGADPGRVVVIRESETPALGELGLEPHVLASGDAVAVTAWSELAQTVLVDPWVARQTLGLLDDVARRVGDRNLAVAWPLAMAATAAGDDAEDSRVYAQDVILRSSPDSLSADEDLLASASAVVRAAAGATTADAWSLLTGLGQSSSALMRDLVVETYLSRAMGDSAWLTGESPAPVPSSHPGPSLPRLRDHADVALREALGSPEPLIDAAARDLRLVDLLLRAGVLSLTGDSVEPLREIAVDLLSGPASSCLRDRTLGPALVARTGHLAPAFHAVLLREVVESGWPELHGDGPLLPGRAWAPEVVGWLCRGEVPDTLVRACADPGQLASRLDLELAQWHVVTGTRRPGLVPVLVAGYLGVVGSWALLAGGECLPPGVGSVAWTPAHLTVVERRFPGQLPAEHFTPALLGSAADSDLLALCTLLTRTRAGSSVADLARLRQLCRADTIRTDEEIAVVSAVIRSCSGSSAVIRWDEIAPVFLELVVVLLAEDRLPRALDEQVAPLVAVAGRASTAFDAARRLAYRMDAPGRRQRRFVELAYLALATSPGLPIRLDSPTARAIGALMVDDAGTPERLLDVPVRYAVEGQHLDDQEAAREQVGAMVAALTSAWGGQDSGDREVHDIDKFARSWWRSVGVDGRHAGVKLLDAFRPSHRKER